jgi:membrane protease subunit HflC
MKKSLKLIIIAAIIFFGIIVAGPFYVINEGEQAVIIRLGELVREVTDAGLHVKIPFIDEVVRYPKKIMSWDGDARSMPTRERQFIWVDVVARWRIADPKKFYESISTIEAAEQKLSEIIDSEVRTVVAENNLPELVRNTNFIQERTDISDTLGLEDSADISQAGDATKYDTILKGRRQLAEEILARSRRMVPEYGIELRDVVARQIRYSDELTQSVHARMIKERNQRAQFIRSEGEGRKKEWEGKMENDKRSIESGAYEEVQMIMGRADATATRIYADAYNRNRNFFEFWRAVESYKTTMPKLDKTLSTDMDYFRYLYSPR